MMAGLTLFWNVIIIVFLLFLNLLLLFIIIVHNINRVHSSIVCNSCSRLSSALTITTGSAHFVYITVIVKTITVFCGDESDNNGRGYGRVRMTFCRWAAQTAWTRARTRRWTLSRHCTMASREPSPLASSSRRSRKGGGREQTSTRLRRRHRWRHANTTTGPSRRTAAASVAATRTVRGPGRTPRAWAWATTRSTTRSSCGGSGPTRRDPSTESRCPPSGTSSFSNTPPTWRAPAAPPIWSWTSRPGLPAAGWLLRTWRRRHRNPTAQTWVRPLSVSPSRTSARWRSTANRCPRCRSCPTVAATSPNFHPSRPSLRSKPSLRYSKNQSSSRPARPAATDRRLHTTLSSTYLYLSTTATRTLRNRWYDFRFRFLKLLTSSFTQTHMDIFIRPLTTSNDNKISYK